MGFVRVASTNEVPNGEGRAFEVGGKTIALFNCDGRFFAIDNSCKHQGGPLAEGELSGTVVTCPWHAWTYDVVTGTSPDDPDCSIERYAVKVDGDAVLIEV